jgi:hypothetical protein
MSQQVVLHRKLMPAKENLAQTLRLGVFAVKNLRPLLQLPHFETTYDRAATIRRSSSCEG